MLGLPLKDLLERGKRSKKFFDDEGECYQAGHSDDLQANRADHVASQADGWPKFQLTGFDSYKLCDGIGRTERILGVCKMHAAVETRRSLDGKATAWAPMAEVLTGRLRHAHNSVVASSIAKEKDMLKKLSSGISSGKVLRSVCYVMILMVYASPSNMQLLDHPWLKAPKSMEPLPPRAQK